MDYIQKTPNRESLRYTQEAKQIILTKLSNVADYFVNKYNEQLTEGGDIRSVINYLEKNGHRIAMGDRSTKKIDDFIKYSQAQVAVPKIEGVDFIDFPVIC